MNKCYAGIGSRETPKDVQVAMKELASDLGWFGWTLRSGAADGADAAFESGLLQHHPREIYLPWPRFNSHPSPLHDVCDEAMVIARAMHPHWDKLGSGARLLHGRNTYQVLGLTLDAPVQCVICWTPGGKGGGGTGQALRLAKSRSIPIFDLALWPVDSVRLALGLPRH